MLYCTDPPHITVVLITTVTIALAVVAAADVAIDCFCSQSIVIAEVIAGAVFFFFFLINPLFQHKK